MLCGLFDFISNVCVNVGAGKKRRKIGNDKPLPPLLVRVGDSVEVLGFNARQRKAFHNAVMRYGMPSTNSYNTHWLSKDLRTKSEREFNAYVSLFMRHLVEPTVDNEETFRDGVPRDGLPRHATLARIGVMKLVRRKVMEYANVNGQYSIPAELLQQLGSLTTSSHASATVVEEKVVENNKKTEEEPPVDSKENTQRGEPAVTESDKDELTGEITSQEQDHEQDQGEPTLKSVATTSNSDLWDKIKKVPFMFNIADGGFTELHGLWEHEEKIQNLGTWSRRHDYWLLAGVAVRGYARWNEILADTRYALLTLPFKEQGTSVDVAAKFMSRRFKLLEQSLGVEEQIKRASYLGITQNGNDPVMNLQNRYSEIECLVETHQSMVKDVGKVGPTALLRRVLLQIDDLLSDMKNELSRLPSNLTRLQSVPHRLQMDEWRIISKLTSREDPLSSRIAPHAHPAPLQRPTGTVTLHPPSVMSSRPASGVSIPATVIATIRPQPQNLIHAPLAPVMRYQTPQSVPMSIPLHGVSQVRPTVSMLPTPPVLTRHTTPVVTVRSGGMSRPPMLMAPQSQSVKPTNAAVDSVAMRDVIRSAKTVEEKVHGIATGVDPAVQSALKVTVAGKSSGTQKKPGKDSAEVVTLD